MRPTYTTNHEISQISPHGILGVDPRSANITADQYEEWRQENFRQRSMRVVSTSLYVVPESNGYHTVIAAITWQEDG